MKRVTRAFTLIELLVVIAIIAILAAILFPVFAQAKESAKKAQDLSNYKQMGTATLIYSTDTNDILPLGHITFPDGRNGWRTLVPYPQDWIPTGSWSLANWREAARQQWANSVQPYAKNYDIFAGNLPKVRNSADSAHFQDPNAEGKWKTTSAAYNGLLHAWSASSITEPSKLIMVWSGYGKSSLEGRTIANPTLLCDTTQRFVDCRFNPTGPPAPGVNCQNTHCWAWFWPGDTASCYVFGQGWNAVRSDSSAKFYRSGRVTGETVGNDFNRLYNDSPFAHIRTSTTEPLTQWGCTPPGSNQTPYYSCMFRPDSDFNYRD
jgi:prepilin-type N-terminal cleavage/methylation domain-containing protein